jgi:CRISPR-associated protein Cas1
MNNGDQSPDYLPARMLNEYVYCPRLFFYEWVEGVFVQSRDTVEGKLRHEKVERKDDALPTAEEAEATGDRIHSRSVTLASEPHKLIAKMDLIEGDGGCVTPVDYKHGSPRENAEDGTLEAWDPDKVQLCVQALILRDNGYRCGDGVIYYVATKQRVRVPIDEELVRFTLDALTQARATAEGGKIPPPLVDSPKCPRCSLVGICLPDETQVCLQITRGIEPLTQRLLFDGVEHPTAATRLPDISTIDVRRLVPARDDLRPLYLNSQGFRVGKSGEVLQVHEKNKMVQEVRLGEISQLNLFGNIQLTTQAIQSLCAGEIPIAYFSQGSWFYGVTHGLGVKNIYLRREQFRLAEVPSFCVDLAKASVAGKIRNQRTMLQRNHVEPPAGALAHLKCMIDDAERAQSMDELLGIEGNAARIYFEHFAGMIKVDSEDDGPSSRNGGTERTPSTSPAPNGTGNGAGGETRSSVVVTATDPPAPVSKPRRQMEFTFDFIHRNRRPPRDAINALLSLAYSVLAKDLTIVCHAVGFDPYLGFYHQPRFGRPALALDLMEPFRPLIADSTVINAVNTRMVTPKDFIQVGPAVALKPEGRKAFFRAYEQRMDTLVTHPLFGYRVNYRRVLEIQARLLARVLTGELNRYPVFVTRASRSAATQLCGYLCGHLTN